MPQTLTPEWVDQLGANAVEIYSRLIDTFGNLTLTGYNTELSNSPFAEKKDLLRTTHIELNRWILDQPTWTEAEITARADLLFGEARGIWTGPR